MGDDDRTDGQPRGRTEVTRRIVGAADHRATVGGNAHDRLMHKRRIQYPVRRTGHRARFGIDAGLASSHARNILPVAQMEMADFLL